MEKVTNSQFKHFEEQEAVKKSQKMRKMRANTQKVLTKQNNTYKKLISKNKNDYEKEVVQLKGSLEKKLNAIRKKNIKLTALENIRLTEELSNLKEAHHDKVEEVKLSQQSFLDDLKETHQRILENAKNKFEKEKMKWEEV